MFERHCSWEITFSTSNRPWPTVSHNALPKGNESELFRQNAYPRPVGKLWCSLFMYCLVVGLLCWNTNHNSECVGFFELSRRSHSSLRRVSNILIWCLEYSLSPCVVVMRVVVKCNVTVRFQVALPSHFCSPILINSLATYSFYSLLFIRRSTSPLYFFFNLIFYFMLSVNLQFVVASHLIFQCHFFLPFMLTNRPLIWNWYSLITYWEEIKADHTERW